MPQPPYLSAQFTLLYGDPGSAPERQYLQPLYGLTQPPAVSEVPASTTSQRTSPASPTQRHDLANMGLLPDLPPESMGPQPIFGGCFLQPERRRGGAARAGGRPAATQGGGEARPRDGDRTGVHFHADGTPSLRSILNDDFQQKTLSCVRRKYPCPSARSGHVFLSCPEKRGILLHGGLEDTSYNDTWLYDVRTGRWRELVCTGRPATPPAGHAGGEAVKSGEAPTATPQSHLMPPCAFGQAGTLYHCYDDVPHPSSDARLKSRRASGRGASRAAPGTSSLRMFITGGIQEDDDCVDRSYSLDVDAQVWSSLELTTELPAMWGSIAETVRVKRRPPGGRKPSAAEWAKGDDEEEVVVVFGGMTVEGKPVDETYLLHLERKLTDQEVYENTDFYLQSIGYDETAQIRAFLQERKAQQEETAGAGAPHASVTGSAGRNLPLPIPAVGIADDGAEPYDEAGRRAEAVAAAMAAAMGATRESEGPAAGTDDLNDFNEHVDLDSEEFLLDSESSWAVEAAAESANNHISSGSGGYVRGTREKRPTVTAAEIASFRASNRDTLDDWRRQALKARVIGRYFVEVLPATPGLPGRRRASSCVYRKKFIFLFGGRDDYGYYNDFWAFNAELRRWIMIRDEVPIFWLSLFFSQPHNEAASIAIASINAQIWAARSDPDRNEQKNPSFMQQDRAKVDMFRKQYEHDNIYASTLNSTAKARTGSVMFIDESKNCVYIFGGFTLSRAQLWTFCDVHAYFIDFHCWRRVTILPSRPFDIRLTAADDSPPPAPRGQLQRVDSCEDASRRTLATAGAAGNSNNNNASASLLNKSPPSVSQQHQHQHQQQRPQPSGPLIRRVSPLLDATLVNNSDNARLAQHSARYEKDEDGRANGRGLRIKDVAPVACSFRARTESLVGMTPMQYAHTYLRGSVKGSPGPHGRNAPVYPPHPVAPRYSRISLLNSGLGAEPGDEEYEPDGFATPLEWFQLPVMAPEARTMAAVAADPLNNCMDDSSDSEAAEDAEEGEGGDSATATATAAAPRERRRSPVYRSGELRFFLHGGRAGEEPRGDLLEIRVKSVSRVDFEYHQTANLLNRWVVEQEQVNINPPRHRAVRHAQQRHAENPVPRGARPGTSLASLPSGASPAEAPGLPPTHTLNSPSNPNLNPINPPTGDRLSTDARLSPAFLSELRHRSSMLSRERLLRASSRRFEEEGVDGRGPNPCTPHGLYEDGDAADTFYMASSEKVRSGSLFLSALSFLRELVDFPIRHRGDTLSCREFHRNFPIIDPTAWGTTRDGAEGDGAAPEVRHVAQRHQEMLTSSARAIRLLAACLLTRSELLARPIGRHTTAAAVAGETSATACAPVRTPPRGPSCARASPSTSSAPLHGAAAGRTRTSPASPTHERGDPAANLDRSSSSGGTRSPAGYIRRGGAAALSLVWRTSRDPVLENELSATIGGAAAAVDRPHSSSGGSPVVVTGSPGTAPDPARPAASVFATFNALATTTMESPPLSPTSRQAGVVPTAFSFPAAAAAGGHAARPAERLPSSPAPARSEPGAPLKRTTPAAAVLEPAPMQPVTHSLRNAHVHLYRIFQTDPYYYSGVSHTHSSPQNQLPHELTAEVLNLLNEQSAESRAGDGDDVSRTGGIPPLHGSVTMELSPQLAYKYMSSLPANFLTQLSL